MTQQAAHRESSSTLAPEAAVSVLRGSFTAAGIVAVGSSVWGVSRALPALPLAVRGGINSFLFAFPFFSIREYLLNPYLVDHDQGAYALHLRNVPQSAVAGAVVGGAMTAWARGPQGLLRGAITFGVLCPGIQLLLNEARVARVLLLTRGSKEESGGGGAAASLPPSPDALVASGVELPRPEATVSESTFGPSTSSPPSSSSTSSSSSASAKVDLKERERSSAHSPSSLAPTSSSPESERVSTASAVVVEEKPKPSIWSRIAAYSPVRPISDEEYQKRLHGREAELVSRLRELEAEKASLRGGAGEARV